VLLLSHDAGMAFHGLLFLIAAAVAAMLVLQIPLQDNSPLEVDSRYMDVPIKVETIAALIWGIAGFVAGDFIA
jgi:cytochrome c oxidase cbb3-type subunit I